MDESIINLLKVIGISVVLAVSVLWFAGFFEDDNDDDWSDRAW